MGGRLAQTVRAGRVGVVTGLFHGVLEEVASGDGALVGVCSFAKEDDGVTPLYVCTQEGHLEGHLEVARALIKAGSNFNGLSSEQVADLCRILI